MRIFFGEWLSTLTETLPNGSVWEVELTHSDGKVTELTMVALRNALVDSMGELEDQSLSVDTTGQRFRRVYSPGSFTVEPRKITDPAQLGDWPLWRVFWKAHAEHKESYESISYMKYAMGPPCPPFVYTGCVPVQMVEIGGISRAVDVPWEAVTPSNTSP